MKTTLNMGNIKKLIGFAIAAGLVLTVIGVATGASRTLYWDKNGISIAKNEVSRITELDIGHVKSVNVSSGYSDIEFIHSDKYGFDAMGYDVTWDWSLNNGALTISNKALTRMAFFSFNIASARDENYVKIYLPAGAELDSVTIKCDTGDMRIGDFQADSVKIENAFGGMELKSITSNLLQVNLDTGKFSGTDINAKTIAFENSFGDSLFKSVKTDKLNVKGDTGDINFDGCEIGDAFITNSFGKTEAKGLVTSKLEIDSDSGDINFDGTFTGGNVIRSAFGKVTLTTSLGKDAYSYDISTDFGKVIMDGEKFGDSATIKSGNTTANHIKITSDSGDVELRFAK